MAKAKKTEATNGTVGTMTSPSEPAPETNGEPKPAERNGTHPDETGDKRSPVFKVGPIPTDRNNAVSAAVWANEITLNSDGRTFTVYNVSVESRWRDADGTWKSGKQYRGSQLYALMYCLQRCSDWICAQRDPQQRPPEQEGVPF